MTVVNDGTTSNDDRLGAIGDIGFVVEQRGIDDDLVVVAGDNLFAEDVSGFARYGREVEAPVIAVHDIGDLSLMHEYNQIEIDAEGRIVFFEEKPAQARTTLAGVALYYYPASALPLVRQYLDEGNNPDQPGPADPVALPAHRGLHLAAPRRVVRHRLGGDAPGSRPHLFAES